MSSLVFKPIAILIYALLLNSCGAASITLSPELGMVSVCPGGQVLLTCERMSGSFLYWDVSIPHLAMTREVIVSSQGGIDTTALRQFNGLHATEFTVTRTSDNPLTSQMMVNNVPTEMNGSTIYCSKVGNENGAPAVAINIIIYYGRFLNVSLVNQLLENNVTVTLQWPREPGAVYSVITMPETPHTEFITNHNNNVVINLTIFYNIQYNVSIVSSLCGATTTRVLKYVTCDLPTQRLNPLVVVVSGSQDSPHREGQFITYTCPPGFILTGPNASECTGNGRWEPDSGQVACIADCGVPLSNASKFNYYSSTLEGSVLILTCENDTSTDETTLNVTCHSNGSWIPDPAGFTCSSFITTVPSGFNNKASGNTLQIITIIAILSGAILILLIILTLCAIKRKCVTKKTSVEPKQQPIYDNIKPYHEEILVEGNDAYGHMIQCHISS